MSAPVPLNSGCCAPPCPNNPQTAVPGPAGENAFAFTVGNFTQPVVGANVTISLTHDGWVVPGQIVFVQGGGFYLVSSVSGLTVTLNNTGTNGNAAPGATINAGAKTSPGGVSGVTGNAYTTTTANFTQPAVGFTVNVAVLSSAWAAIGQVVFIATGGYYSVFNIPDGTHLTLTNLGYSGNAAPTTVINSPVAVSPGGLIGPTGSTGLGTLNSISPTTTKGDLIVDNGGGGGSANDVRFGVGVGNNGKALVVDSTQATGLNYATITPNTVATSGDIAIFNGASGTPVPLQDSKLLISSTGAIQSTPTGGNARGTSATDLQVVRGANTQVASGTRSALVGGQNNTAAGTNSFIGGGENNTASGLDSTCAGGNTNLASNQSTVVSGGNSNTASGSAAAVLGGASNTASGLTSCVVGGNTNTASGDYSFCGGGQNNTAGGLNSTCLGSLNFIGVNGNAATVVGGTAASVNLYGQVAHANGFFAQAGDAQTSELIWRIATTDATANVEAFLDGSSLRAVVPLNTTWGFEIIAVGRSSAGVSAVWRVTGGIQNNANTVSLVAAVTTAVLADGTGSTWGVVANFVVSADNTNKSLKIAVTGAGATNIRWVTRARLVEVNY